MSTFWDQYKRIGGGKLNTKTKIVESIKVIPAAKIDSKTWRKMKYDLRDQFDELVKIGQDYGVFESAQGTAKVLKQIKNLLHKL